MRRLPYLKSCIYFLGSNPLLDREVGFENMLDVDLKRKAELYLAVGATMLSIGFILALLGSIEVISPSLLLYFLTYAISIAGLVVGIIGIWLKYGVK